jgi:hypothetical protein
MRASASGDLLVQVDDDLVELWPSGRREVGAVLGPTASNASDLADQSIDLRGAELAG